MIISSLDEKLKTLNENQLKAVLHIDKPLFVVAGAGTGKTNTLTTKIAYLIDSVNANPESILAVTFTNKAAKEIRDRVNALIFPKQTGSWLYTFHAFALRILRSHATNLEIGYSNDFKVIDEDDSLKIIKEVIEKLNVNKEKVKPKAIKSLISRHKLKMDYLIDSEEVLIYEEYQSQLIYNDLMDFDDLIVYAHKLFTKNEQTIKYYQNIFKYVLVDEFQDTDKLQYEIIKAISASNTFVVGDPDQSIYGFRGARYENNQKFINDFNAEIITLDLNYRSTNNILKIANKLINNNKDRPTTKELKSELGLGDKVVYKQFDDNNGEVNFVVHEVYKLLEKGIKPDDIAILYRNNALSRNFEHAFNRYQIPYIIYGGISFYERKEVKDILAYLHVLVSQKSDFYLKRIINVPSRKIGRVTLNKLEEYALFNNITMFDAIDHVDTLSAATIDRLKEFKQIILKMRKEIDHLTNLVQVIDVVLNETNYAKVLEDEAPEVAKERRENILELKNVFFEANYLEGYNSTKIKTVLDELALFSSLDNSDYNNKIRLATVHQVKGLEFKVVFVVSLENELFPNYRASLAENRLEEERRLFYVAITRAKENLYLSNAIERFLYGQVTYQKRSIFLDEILKEDINEESSSDYKVGDIIYHNLFGKGVIVSIKNNNLDIAFSYEHGIKKISESFPGIKKVTENEEV